MGQGYIYERNDYWSEKQRANKGLLLSNSFFKEVEIHKSKKEFECCICRNKKGKGNRYCGGGWSKVCSNCLELWLSNTKITFQRLIEVIDESLNDVKLNKEVWDKEQIINNL